MELKKSPKADLEGQKNLYIEMGLVVALGLMLIAFEWSRMDIKTQEVAIVEEAVMEEEMIPITRQEPIKPPPPPPPPRLTDILNVVDDDIELEEELEIDDTEIDEDTQIDIVDIASDLDDEVADAEVFQIVETMPSFPGGEGALMSFLSKNTNYPVIAQENGIQGRVYINFVVNTDGTITNVKVVRPVDPALDREALRVVNSMPTWIPGEQRGRKVRVSFNLPVNFTLR